MRFARIQCAGANLSPALALNLADPPALAVGGDVRPGGDRVVGARCPQSRQPIVVGLVVLIVIGTVVAVMTVIRCGTKVVGNGDGDTGTAVPALTTRGSATTAFLLLLNHIILINDMHSLSDVLVLAIADPIVVIGE